jgi:PAS domain S-box-containing protein
VGSLEHPSTPKEALQRLRELEQKCACLEAENATLRAHAEEARNRTAALNSAILEAALDSVITIGRDSRVVEWNEAAERTFGYGREQALGRDLAQLIIPPEYRERHYQGMAHYLATGHGPILRKRVELVAIRADGSRFPVELAISPLPIGGEPHFTAYLRDISERKRAQSELRDREQRLQATYESAFAGIGEVDSTGRFLRVNEEFCAITGYSRDELLGLTVVEITHRDDTPREQELFGRQMAGEIGVYRSEKRFIHRSGHPVWIDLSASRVDDEEGHPLYGVRVIRDITERKKAEEQIRFQARLLDAVEEAVIATDLVGTVLYWNRFAEGLYGWSAEEALGRSILELNPTTETKAQAEAVMAELRAGHVWSGEIILQRRDGTTFPALVTNAPVYDHTGELVAIVGTSYDITPRKKWEERQRLLINELNHRVKNTLATVQSIASQTLRNAGTPEQAREDIEGRLIALSRAHDVLTRESWEGANLKQIVRQAIEPYQSRGEDRFHLAGSDLRLPPRLALVVAMALQELVTNAVKYGALSNETGLIEISWRASEDKRMLELDWRESGGPPVVIPTRKGFGTRLIERGLAAELGGEARLEYEPDGVRCRISAPLLPQ